ncbi:hypothetical protein [Pseudomonas sp. v388]|nr:hypothetical protein [Pseudomonas sp. v388]
MKPHLLMGLLLSMFCVTATAAAPDERIAENGPDRLVKQFQRV